MTNSLADSIEIPGWNESVNSDSGFPTLEDALNDVENFDDSLSFLNGSETASILGASGLTTSSTYQHTEPGISCVRLESQTHQILSLANKSGSPTCISECNGLLAVGGNKGMIMLFNFQGRLEAFFVGDVESGSVTCLTFSADKKYLAAGYGRGIVKVFNTKKHSLIYIMRDAVQPGTSVLQVVYLESSSSLMTLDSGGNVFEIRLKHTITRKLKHSIRCIFSGCNGEVLHIKVIPHRLVVLLTVTKILIITTERGGSVICVFPVKTFEPYPPLFDYNLTTDRHSKWFRICVGRGEKIFIFALDPDKFQTKEKVATILKSILLPFKAVMLSWISPDGVIAFDNTGRSVYINVEKGTSSKGLPYDLSITFASSSYKALEVGGAISEAMNSIAETVCYPSVHRTSDNTFLVLTYDGLYTIWCNNELDQLEQYQNSGDYVSACQFLLELLNERQKTVIKKGKLLELLIGVLRNFTKYIVEDLKDGHDYMTQYRKNILLLLQFCIESGQQNVIYDFAWPRFEEDSQLRAIFLELLDEFVLDGDFSSAPPEITSAYLQYLSSEGHFSQFQSAICRFPIHSIDIHMVMTLCRQNNLYDGVIHIMNKALLDFIGPLEEMLENVAIFASNDVKSDAEIEQGNRLLLYIQCCLAGHGYPLGELPNDAKSKVPLEVYRCITSLRGKDGGSFNKKYPNLQILLQFDAQQFFHVISTCADAELFTTNEGRLQNMMEILGEISDMIGTSTVLEQYFIVITRLMESSHIIPSVDLLERCICTLLRNPIITESTELTVIELLEVVTTLNRDLILQLSLRPFRVNICTYIYFSRRRFTEILQAVLNFENKKNVFSIVQKILLTNLSQKEMAELTAFLKSTLYELSSVDTQQLAVLLLDNFLTFFTDLKGPKNFSILKAAFEIRKKRAEPFLTSDEELDEVLFNTYFQGLVEVCHERDDTLKQIMLFWLPMGSRSDFCLNIAMPNGKYLTSLQLIEARGFTHRAFELIFEKISSANTEADAIAWTDELLSFVGRHVVEANENNWLINSFREISRRYKNSDNEIDQRMVSLIRKIMLNRTGHAYELFLCLLESRLFANSDLTKARMIINETLISCKYEHQMLTTILNTMEYENTQLLQSFVHQTSRKNCKLTIPECYSCKQPMNKSSYAYACGHIIHIDCDVGKRRCICAESYKEAIRPVKILRNKERAIKRDIFTKWEEELCLVPQI